MNSNINENLDKLATPESIYNFALISPEQVERLTEIYDMVDLLYNKLSDFDPDKVFSEDNKIGEGDLKPSLAEKINDVVNMDVSSFYEEIENLNQEVININANLEDYRRKDEQIILDDLSPEVIAKWTELQNNYTSLVNKIKEINDKFAEYRRKDEKINVSDLDPTLIDLLNKKFSSTKETIIAGDDIFYYNTDLNDSETSLLINGITYFEDEDYRLDREHKVVFWLFNAENGGFNLSTDFNIKLICFE